MSGGSFDYLCHSWDLDELLKKQYQLQPMVDALMEYGDRGTAAAQQTYAVSLMLRTWQAMIEVHLKQLTPVWKAVEWHHSSDWGKDRVEIALDHFNNVPVAELHSFVPTGNVGWGCTGCSWIVRENPNYMDEAKARDMHKRDHRAPS